MTKKIFLAMSGGVDSSVAAALIKKAANPKDFEKIFGRATPKGFSGFDAVGVFMKPWAPELPITNLDCLWEQDREDALRVAAKLDIPLLTWDFSKAYEKYVAEYMIKGYQRGITPNPDVMCNKFIKFGLFLDKALEVGADYIATGHYVRLKAKGVTRLGVPRRAQISRLSTVGVRRGRTPPRFSLHVAKDKNKDQSYFLYTLTQKQLKHCLFPIGDYTKDEVRKMAKKIGLPNWAKPDSQGVCFIGPLEVGEFLKKFIKPRKGLVLRKSDDKILGEHDGAWFYTIGQRHGMNLSAGKPYYVVDKDLKNNVLYVEERLLEVKNLEELEIIDFNLITKEKLPLDCKVKIRYRQKDLDCTIVKNGFDKALARIKKNNTPVAPGQAAVFYKGEEVLGGGIIS